MDERDIGLEIVEGIREIKEFKEGQIYLHICKLSEPSAPKIAHNIRLGVDTMDDKDHTRESAAMRRAKQVQQ